MQTASSHDDERHAVARTGILGTWLRWVRTLYPGYFASVMATGIVSIALLLTGASTLSLLLWAAGFALLAFFVVIYVLRWLLYGREVRQDAFDPSKVFGFFTCIAAFGVLATRSDLGRWSLVAGVLTLLAAALWCLLTYWTFAMLLFTNTQPIQRSVNGSWLIAIVATESLAITWVLLAPLQPELRPALQLLAFAFWTFGMLLYLIFIALIMYRFFFFALQPSDLTPPYWINMGAMAITTVAGARLLSVRAPTAFLALLQPFVEGFTVMMWAWGTWWIPLLVIIGVWKYVIQREPVRYHPALWSIVFPLGMYATALHLLSHLPGLTFLAAIAPAASWIAFAAWVLVAVGWVVSAVAAARPALHHEASPRTGRGSDTRSPSLPRSRPTQ